MALESLRRYDVQARYAALLAVVSLAPFVVAAALAWRNYDPVLGQIIYGSRGRFVETFVVCVLLSMVPGVLGFCLGWNSAGQRRNDQSQRSWLGFFLGGGVVTFDFILLLAFYMLRLEKPF